MKTIRYGILGLGVIGDRFARVVRTVEGSALAAVAARDLGRAAQFAARHGGARAYGSYRELAADPDVDAVYIALTHNFHAEAVRLCLENGKAVLCEKPFVLRGDEARALAAMAREKGLSLMEAMWTRFLPPVRQARAWVRDGRIGQVKLVRADFCFCVPYDPGSRLFNPALAGGALYDVGVYVAEFANGVLDALPVAVKAVSTLSPTGVDEYTALSLRYQDGALASLACGIRGAAPTDALIVGTGGRIVVRDFFQSRRCELLGPDGETVEVYESGYDDGFRFQIEHFAEMVRTGTPESTVMPWRDTIGCADLFDEVRAQCGMA